MSTLSRRQVADAIDELDDQLADLQELKKAVYQNYRAALASRSYAKDAIKAEAAAIKLAIRRRRHMEKDPEGTKTRDYLLDQILLEITAEPARGARARSKDDASADRPLHSIVADTAKAEVEEAMAAAEVERTRAADADFERAAAPETGRKLEEEDDWPEDKRKAQIKAAADRAEERARRGAGAPRTH